MLCVAPLPAGPAPLLPGLPHETTPDSEQAPQATAPQVWTNQQICPRVQSSGKCWNNGI